MLKEEKNILWRASAVCLGVALPALLFGKAWMFALLALGVLAGLLATKGESLRATVKLMWKNPLLLLLGALVLVWGLGVVFGISPVFSFSKWKEMLGLVVIAGLLFMTLREMPGGQVEFLVRVLSYATVGACLLALGDALLGNLGFTALIHGPEGEGDTPYRLNFFSPILAVILPFVWAHLMAGVQEGEPRATQFAPWVVGLGLITVVVCGGRSGWVGFLVGGILFLALAGRYHHTILHARHYLMLVAGVFVGVALYTLSHGWGFVEARVNPAMEAEMGRGVMSGRLDVWQKAFEHLGDSPVLGIGLNAYRNLPDAIDMHPHNWLLQVGLETGFLGTSLFLLLLFMIAVTFHRFAKGNLYGVAAFSSFMAFWVAAFANTSIFNVWWVLLFVVTALLGWRVGWSTPAAKKLRRGKLLKRNDLLPKVR